MHRKPLLALLDRYAESFPGERDSPVRMAEFVRRRGDCFERSCLEGHVTASAWIVSHDHRRVLLTHHRKLDRWLQLGGHADGDCDTERVALCEAREESGMQDFSFIPGPDGLRALDVDVHPIPARPREPEHFHHDVCYLLVAAPDQPLEISDESHDLAWVGWDEAIRLARDEDSMARKARKARERLRGVGGTLQILP